MPVVNINLSQLSGADPNIEHLKNARIDFSPYKAYPEADTWVTRTILRVKCPAGVAAPDVPATPAGNAFEVQERGFRGARHGYVIVPDVPTVNYVDLVWVDKATLAPDATLDPAWAAIVQNLDDRVTGLEGGTSEVSDMSVASMISDSDSQSHAAVTDLVGDITEPAVNLSVLFDNALA